MNNETLEQIRQTARIVDVVSDYFQLKKKGTEYQCLCPFHSDRRLGSFTISPKTNRYHCFACGADGDAIEFVKKMEGCGFEEAATIVADKYSIEVKGSSRPTVRLKRLPAPAPIQQQQLPMLSLPQSMVIARKDTSSNVFANWLRSLPWNLQRRARVEQVLRNYAVGTEKGHPENCIFWQIDNKWQVHTGKIMRYHQNGRRDSSYFSWVHSRLFKAGVYDENKVQMVQCLFGLHQLGFIHPQTVSIVESEKTAIICTIAYGEQTKNVWLATGGKENLKAEKLQPVMQLGCQINCYPDIDGMKEWEERVAEIHRQYDRIYLVTAPLTDNKQYWRTDKPGKTDIADIIINMITRGDFKQDPDPELDNPKRSAATEALEDLMHRLPVFNELVQGLRLDTGKARWTTPRTNRQ